MNILVTGGAGYIGSHLVKQLGEQTKYNITILDNLVTGFENSLLYGEFINADLSDYDNIDRIFAENSFDVVIHFAASLVVPESVTNPLKYYLNNTANTTNLISVCIKHNVNKFIFSSTAAIYGEQDADNIIVTEESSTGPLNPYGTSKFMSEMVLRDASSAYKDFNYVVLRYFNVAGASVDGKIGQSTKNATVLVKVAAECAVGKRDKMYIFGEDYPTDDGTCIRDYIHVEDLASAHIEALDYLKSNESNLFNCGYGKGYSVKEVIDMMKKISGNDFEVQMQGRREGDPSALIADCTKIKNMTNWLPKYDNLELICKTAYEWEKKI